MQGSANRRIHNDMEHFKYLTGAIVCLLLLASCANTRGGVLAASPDWVRDPHTLFDRQTYLAAVGNGNSRALAESDAIGRLVSIFGQSIQVDKRVAESYWEAVDRGAAASWTQTTAIGDRIYLVT